MNMPTNGVITMKNKNCNDNGLCEKRDKKDCTRMTYTNSNEENEGRKLGAKLLFCALLATYVQALQKA
jgi:hypothetical protein